jgi:stress response protein YsnF
MPQVTEAYEWRGRTVVTSDGDKIGTLEEIYLDSESGQPEWATVRTGLFGAKQTFVPLAQVDHRHGEVVVPYEKDMVKDAPSVDPDGHLSPDDEARLYRHYGFGSASRPAEPVGRDVSGPTTDDAMTRSEEQLRVGKTRRPSELVRLKKHVTTDYVTKTVPVEREEVRIEREPVTEANVDQATSGPELSESEHEVVLESEEVAVDKEVVPKERVRLDKDVATEERTVDEEVRKEEVEIERGQPRNHRNA